MDASRLSKIVALFERNEISRRQFFASAAALGVSFGVAERALAAGSATLDTRRARARQAVAEGVVTINDDSAATFIPNFNPLRPANAAVRPAANAVIFEPLLVWDVLNRRLVQSLATGYTLSADATELRFDLVPNVLWSDGEPFTAADVVFTWDLLSADESLQGVRARMVLPRLDSWEALDDHTVMFRFTEPFVPGLYAIAEEYIVPQHIWRDLDPSAPWDARTLVATGPITELVRFEDQYYELGANPNYRFADQLKVTGTRYPALANNTDRALALQNGELDWAMVFLPDADEVFVAANPEKHGYLFEQAGPPVMLWINTSVAPFDNVEVRKGISMAIDREMLCDLAMYGYADPADATGLGKLFDDEKDPQALAMPWTSFDLAQANESLDAGGLELVDGVRHFDGAPFEFELAVSAAASDYLAAAEMIVEQLGAVGISVRLNIIDYSALNDRFQQGAFQAALHWSTQGPTVYDSYRILMSGEAMEPLPGGTIENVSRWTSPQADSLLEEYAAAVDEAEQYRISGLLQNEFANNLPSIPLFYGPEWYEYTTYRFDGFPTAENPYSLGLPIRSNAKHVLLNLHPVGTEAPQLDEVIVPAVVRTGDEATPEASPMSERG